MNLLIHWKLKLIAILVAILLIVVTNIFYSYTYGKECDVNGSFIGFSQECTCSGKLIDDKEVRYSNRQYPAMYSTTHCLGLITSITRTEFTENGYESATKNYVINRGISSLISLFTVN